VARREEQLPHLQKSSRGCLRSLVLSLDNRPCPWTIVLSHLLTLSSFDYRTVINNYNKQVHEMPRCFMLQFCFMAWTSNRVEHTPVTRFCSMASNFQESHLQFHEPYVNGCWKQHFETLVAYQVIDRHMEHSHGELNIDDVTPFRQY
jgi:hypothetical protein